MKVYIVFKCDNFEFDETVIGVFLNKKDADDMLEQSPNTFEYMYNIEQHELIE